jgi:hypothetical protein
MFDWINVAKDSDQTSSSFEHTSKSGVPENGEKLISE